LGFLVDFAGSGVLLILLLSTGLAIVGFEISLKLWTDGGLSVR